MQKTNLSKFDNSWYNPGAGLLKRLLWYYTNAIFLNSYLLPVSSIKVFLLRLFGAKVGKNVVIKPKVNIKYPWNISIGDYTWVGEKVWIDSLGKVTIGNNVSLSQEAYLLTGNHDYSIQSFDLVVKEIILNDGVWIGAKSVVCPGVTCHSHSMLSVASVATKDLEADGIYKGNPAVKVKERIIG